MQEEIILKEKAVLNEGIATKEKQEISNSKKKDSSSKIIFGNHELCAQFLKGYTEIPFLKDVQPEDIEDVTERYVRMFQEERNSDVVKKVRIRNSEVPFYLISLIEHKANVDYNVVMQMLRYMVCIWEEYEKEAEKRHKGISRTKIMMLDKIQSKEDFHCMLDDVPGEYLEDVVKDTPEELRNITADVIDVVTANANLPENERDTLRGYVKENKMGELFSHMKGYDIQATRAEARAEEREEGIKKLVKSAKTLGADKKQTKQQLTEQYELSDSDALEKVKQYWN